MWRLLLVLVCVVTPPDRADACTCGRWDQPTLESCRTSKRAFAGTVESYRWPASLELMAGWGPEQIDVRLQVERVWSGDVPGQVYSWTGHGGGDCGIAPEPGTRFLVCDDLDDDADPDFDFCSSPAFDVPMLEASLGIWREPATPPAGWLLLIAAAVGLVASLLSRNQIR
ncbi:hypothetical protein BH11MYX3_BH11MYX3_14830 [soil metagenome]